MASNPHLTDREREVLTLMCAESLTAATVARLLGISVFTVHNHVLLARRKLHAAKISGACYRIGREEAR